MRSQATDGGRAPLSDTISRELAIRPSGVASSLLLAIGNVVATGACVAIARLSQGAVLPWLWALSFLWLLTLGPMVLPLVTILFAARDFSSGQRVQALCAIAIAALTGAALWGRVEVGF